MHKEYLGIRIVNVFPQSSLTNVLLRNLKLESIILDYQQARDYFEEHHSFPDSIANRDIGR